MMEWLVPCALALDLLLGDPRGLPHPVVLMGRLIRILEQGVEWLFVRQRLAGILLVLLTTGITVAVAAGLLHLAALFHPVAGWLLALWLAYTTLALRSLHRESRQVVKLIEGGHLFEARRALSLIVGRDTAELDQEDILKACIETVAENTSDGVIAPMFYLFLGGPVLALAYKSVNTLDSMVGYRTDRYRELGWASARLDDLLNLIPARLTGLLMVLSAFPLRLNSWGGLIIMLRDARKPTSPNSGYPESAVAGALGIELGGAARYFGRRTEKPTLGDADRPVTVACYRQTVRLMYGASLLMLILGVAGIRLLG